LQTETQHQHGRRYQVEQRAVGGSLHVPQQSARRAVWLAVVDLDACDPVFDPHTTIVLAGEERSLEAEAGQTRVRIADYTPERVVIDVETETDGYLFLSDAYYPGWRATIDGAPTTIYRADIMFRAVFVPAGAHEIVYTYDPFAR